MQDAHLDTGDSAEDRKTLIPSTIPFVAPEIAGDTGSSVYNCH